MKAWLKGGLIGLLIGYASYIILYYYFRYFVVTLYKVGTVASDISLIGSIPGVKWFLLYNLIFFGTGALIGWLIGRRKK